MTVAGQRNNPKVFMWSEEWEDAGEPGVEVEEEEEEEEDEDTNIMELTLGKHGVEQQNR